MPKKSSQPCRPNPDAIAEQASTWLVRRDRGLTPAEQDDYMQWLTADPRHAEVLAQHATAFNRMMKLYEWRLDGTAEPNPDLFLPRRTRSWRSVGLGLAAAVAIMIGGAVALRYAAPQADPLPQTSHLRMNERRALADGSVVELKDGSRIVVEFSEEARRVRLTGEAHFIVAKDPARPFVVAVRGVAIRAVGTAFNVRPDASAVEVLVTEGRVAVATRMPEVGGENPEGGGQKTEDGVLSAVGGGRWSEILAGQRAIVPLASDAEPEISEVTADEVKNALGWQVPRLQFFETPFALAVQEFNQHNRLRLVVADRELGAVPIGGTFRVDNPEGFVRLLELTLNIKAELRGENEIVLSRQQ